VWSRMLVKESGRCKLARGCQASDDTHFRDKRSNIETVMKLEYRVILLLFKTTILPHCSGYFQCKYVDWSSNRCYSS
jgi:hypothetical protein